MTGANGRIARESFSFTISFKPGLDGGGMEGAGAGGSGAAGGAAGGSGFASSGSTGRRAAARLTWVMIEATSK